MTPDDVKGLVTKLATMISDSEIAHGFEDELLAAVLRAIADGKCDDPRGCAAEALKALELDYPRWYA